MNNDELRELITLMETGDLNVLELRRPAFRLRLEIAGEARRGAPALTDAVAGMAGAVDSAATVVTAPGFGIFSTRHPARQEAYCEDGAQVACGDTLAMLRINEIYIPVLSPASGRLRRLVADETLIGYAAPLFEIVAQ